MRVFVFIMIGLFTCFFPRGLSAQEEGITPLDKNNQGRLYLYWGWNRSAYTPSNIHFTGPHYDFTLAQVIGKDRQTPFAFDVYFHPTKLTIPQTNFGLGYFLRDHYILTFSVDHMKYVVQQNQQVEITGTIDQTQSIYDGNYEQEKILIQSDLLKMEHTDGLNFIAFGLSRADHLFSSFLGRKEKVELQIVEGVETGLLMPRTDVTVLNQENSNKYHLSGWGAALKVGLHLTLFKHYFIHAELKGGYANLFDIPTTPDGNTQAQQDFLYLQRTIQFGGIFYLPKRKK